MNKTILGLIVTAAAFAVSATTASAAPWSGFCWGQKADGVHCTDIGPSLFPNQFACTNWANHLGATKSGSVRDTDLSRLQDKQEQTCNYVVDKDLYACFFEQHCVAAQTTHPTGHSVFVANVADAAAACVDRAGSTYLDALKALPAGCSLSVKAVLTMP